MLEEVKTNYPRKHRQKKCFETINQVKYMYSQWCSKKRKEKKNEVLSAFFLVHFMHTNYFYMPSNLIKNEWTSIKLDTR